MLSIPKFTPFFLFTLATAVPHKRTPGNDNSHTFSLQMSSKYSFGGTGNITAPDKLRLQQIRSSRSGRGSFAHQKSRSKPKFSVNGTSSNVSIPTTSLSPVFLMTSNIEVGTPPTTFELLVDTGSSNFVVGANPAGTLFVPSASTVSTGEAVSVSYGSGFFIGEEFIDNVTIGNIAPVKQSLAVPNFSEGFDLFDGIIGLGLAALTEGTLTDEPSQIIPTITDTLFSSELITQHLAALTVPFVTNAAQEGSVDFGAVDPSKHNSSVAFAPLVTTGQTAGFWSVSQSVAYGAETAQISLVNNTPGIVDVGTSLLLLPTAAFQSYMQLTNSTLDPVSGLLTIDPGNVDNLQSLFFTIGDNTPLEFEPNAQLFPRSLVNQAGLDPSMVYLIVADGDTGGGGIDFINGYVFLERYYSVFDTTNSQVGFAYNDQTFADVN